LNERSVDFKVKIKNQIHEFEKLQEATERNHRQEIQRLLKDTNEKEEELLKQIGEREKLER
jgi:acetyl-CoA carboxylase alpha subunit